MIPGCKGNVTETKDGYECAEETITTTEELVDDSTANDDSDSGIGGIGAGELSDDLAVGDVETEDSDSATISSDIGGAVSSTESDTGTTKTDD